jgi:hypothetical protein
MVPPTMTAVSQSGRLFRLDAIPLAIRHGREPWFELIFFLFLVLARQEASSLQHTTGSQTLLGLRYSQAAMGMTRAAVSKLCGAI